MKLVDLFEAAASDLKKGQKITVTKDSPEFSDVPTAGQGNGYLHSFKKGDVLRIYSIGKVWIVIESVTKGTGIYTWKTGKKTTEYKTTNYKWRIDPSKFDGSWYEAQNDDRPDDWTASTMEEAKDWIAANGSVSKLKDNGDGTFDADQVRLNMRADTKIRVKFRKVEYFILEKAIPSLEMVPETDGQLTITLGKDQALSEIKSSLASVESLTVYGQFTDVSKFPEFPKVKRVSFNSKKLTSIKGFSKKFPIVDSLALNNADKLKTGLAELAMVKSGSNWPVSIYLEKDKNAPVKKAFDIVKQFVGQGKAGMLSAQEALSDADLEDFE